MMNGNRRPFTCCNPRRSASDKTGASGNIASISASFARIAAISSFVISRGESGIDWGVEILEFPQTYSELLASETDRSVGASASFRGIRSIILPERFLKRGRNGDPLDRRIEVQPRQRPVPRPTQFRWRSGQCPSVLYMAALVASRHNPVFKAYYQRLIAASKAKKLALTVLIRKLVILSSRPLKTPNFSFAT